MAGYSHLLSNNAFGKVKSTHAYQGGTTFLGHSKFTNKTTAFNFTNKYIESERGKVNPFAKEFSGQIYGGNIGEN